MLEVLQRGIDALPPKQQTAVILYYLHGYSLAEAAEIADCNVGTMKSRLHYALKALRTRLPVERRIPVTAVRQPRDAEGDPMSCRRIRRELLWLVRFGDFDAGSAPHLEHLAGCQGCRDEVGLDRALVRQLRTALAERIGDATPSPSAWEGVLARMAPAGAEGRAAVVGPKLAAFLRAGSAMAGASLALVLALNLELAPIGRDPDTGVHRRPMSPRRARRPGGMRARHREGRAPAAGPARHRGDRATVVWVPTPSEQLPLARTTLDATAGADVEAVPATDPADDFADCGPALAIHLVPIDAATISNSSGTDASGESNDPPAAPAAPPAGGPS